MFRITCIDCGLIVESEDNKACRCTDCHHAFLEFGLIDAMRLLTAAHSEFDHPDHLKWYEKVQKFINRPAIKQFWVARSEPTP